MPPSSGSARPPDGWTGLRSGLPRKHANDPPVRQAGGIVHSRAVQPIAPDQFERYVGDAMDGIPEELFAQFDTVVVVVEDEHPDDPELLGLYDGTPLTERGDWGGFLPDRISIYRIPLCLMASDTDDLIEEIRITVVHEFAHHMGIDDDHLHDLGWD